MELLSIYDIRGKGKIRGGVLTRIEGILEDVKSVRVFLKRLISEGKVSGRVYKLSFISSFRLNFESSKLRVGSVWNILLRVASSTTRQFFDVNRKNCLNRYLRRVLQRGNADEYNVYRPGFIGPRKSFLHRNGRSAGNMEA